MNPAPRSSSLRAKAPSQGGSNGRPAPSTKPSTQPKPTSSTASRSKNTVSTGSSKANVSSKNYNILSNNEEEKVAQPGARGFTNKPSAKLANVKVADPFAPVNSMKTF